jgi:transcriptional regulator with XRE-family HTH domain
MPADEDLADLIKRIQDQHGVSQSDIARRLGISNSAVNLWVNRRRGSGRGPGSDTLRKLAAAYGIPEREVFAAAGRKQPGPVEPDAEARIVSLYRELTAEQQYILEVQMRALAEDNRHSGIFGPK